jgi:small subunit ribosomal protein S8
MSMTDPIADLLTRIRNGQSSGKAHVRVAFSGIKQAILQVLKDEGYVADFRKESEGSKDSLVVELKYFSGKPVIEHIQRVSTPGRRVFRGKDELPKVMGGLGVAIVSTSQGVMSDRRARTEGHGGEVLCVVS